MTVVYTHPDGHEIDFADDTLTVTTAFGKSVSIPIGVYGLLTLSDELENVAAALDRKDWADIPSATKGNGLDAANDQPAKTITKHTTDVIAHAARYATVDDGLCFLLLVLALQFTLIIWGAM